MINDSGGIDKKKWGKLCDFRREIGVRMKPKPLNAFAMFDSPSGVYLHHVMIQTSNVCWLRKRSGAANMRSRGSRKKTVEDVLWANSLLTTSPTVFQIRSETEKTPDAREASCVN